jgi:uncharacterized protein (DUF305 family)
MMVAGRGLVGVCIASVATAQMEHGATDNDNVMAMGCGDGTCTTTTAFMHENMAMHDAMAIEFTCNVEVDFVRGMIPHHAGAIKMCEILRGTSAGTDHDEMGRRRAQPMNMGGGLDAFLDSLCTDIEAGQATEVASMEEWLTINGYALTAPCIRVDPHTKTSRATRAFNNAIFASFISVMTTVALQ